MDFKDKANLPFFPFHHFRALSSFPGTNLGRFNNVFTRDTPSRADHSFSISACISSSLSLLPSCRISLPFRTVPERFKVAAPEGSSFSLQVATWSTELSCSFNLVLDAVDELFVSRKRHTTAQSSILEVGYLYLQARTADSTRNLAAEARAGADAIMSTTSLFDSTSQICGKFT
jgi:hypothetical protein